MSERALDHQFVAVMPPSRMLLLLLLLSLLLSLPGLRVLKVFEFRAQRRVIRAGGEQGRESSAGGAAPDQKTDLKRAFKPRVGRQIARQIPAIVLPHPHIDAEFELAALIGNEAVGVLTQIDDGAARRDPRPQMKSRPAVQIGMASRPLNPAAGEHAVVLTRLELETRALPWRGVAGDLQMRMGSNSCLKHLGVLHRSDDAGDA